MRFRESLGAILSGSMRTSLTTFRNKRSWADILCPMVCPAQIVPVGMRQTGTRGAGDGTRKEAQSGAGSEHVAADRSGGGQREDDTAGMQRSGDRGADLLSLA